MSIQIKVIQTMSRHQSSKLLSMLKFFLIFEYDLQTA